jgi:hypothetical protein
MPETIHRRRIETLVAMPLAPRLIAASAKAGSKGHTLLPTQSGAGEGGSWSDDQSSGAVAKVLFAAVTTDERAQAMIDLVAPLLDAYGLVLIASDAEVMRGAKF